MTLQTCRAAPAGHLWKRAVQNRGTEVTEPEDDRGGAQGMGDQRAVAFARPVWGVILHVPPALRRTRPRALLDVAAPVPGYRTRVTVTKLPGSGSIPGQCGLFAGVDAQARAPAGLVGNPVGDAGAAAADRRRQPVLGSWSTFDRFEAVDTAISVTTAG
ncbi:hypothetical protein [Streptomyces sp. MK5]|uniref:hypothetical protein n=1 Tax=Streptomyces sp. MK5 TaxID=3064253 RepID=UPI002740F593|nr:hypothetical protein [Streptomyces sp. MK5]